ncbi:MAG: hypothetical protein IT445_00265 [Phycisphaeraceae bacterium]|nr:hypothetical protein [Phycisphaeraceae bacterium]
MKNQLALLIGVVVVGVLAIKAISFQVRYDQVAVRATFEKAGEKDLIDEPGFRFRWPWPVQTVYTYPRKLQLLDSEAAEALTADSKAIIVKLYVTWKIDNALDFYVNNRDIRTAENTMRPWLRKLTNLVPQYEFRQFVNTDQKQLKLADFEQACTEALRQELASHNLGIHIEHVGVRSILLSSSITSTVFDAMRKHRERLAEQARSEGEAEAGRIRERAKSTRDIIIAFADRRAQAIRDEGDREAEQYFSQFRQDEPFAIYLHQIETLKDILSHNTTFILDANQLWFLKPLTEQPEAAQ